MIGGAIKDPSHTGTSKGLSQAINKGPIRKFLPKYAHVYVTIHSHGLSAGVRTHYVTANEVKILGSVLPKGQKPLPGNPVGWRLRPPLSKKSFPVGRMGEKTDSREVGIFLFFFQISIFLN